ncbi:beta-lactamase/transpeptidase-like protein [Poronia punctata]|nr:beta-lactamase/transpeptidase-like protein [Poronia punctata]
MLLPTRSLILLTTTCLLRPTTATPPCPLEGPVFPKPLHLSQSNTIKTAVANLTTTFEDFAVSSAKNFSFTLSVFSAHDAEPVFSFFHTAPKLASINTTGVKTVDSDTVFRIGSLTKVLTNYLFLINAGDRIWNEPITKYVDELRALGNGSEVTNTAWDQVTIGGLASQMTGIPRDYALLGELTQTPATRDKVIEYGFPPLSDDERPPCGDFPTCDREQFFHGIASFYPSLAPFTSPAYSNVAFQLLGYALETITGKTFDSLLQETLINPLGLNRTFLRKPEESLGVIQGTPAKTGWTFDLGESAAAGNMYTSITDLSTIGRSILSYKLLDPVPTRRWLKPFSFSTDPKAAVGAPWGARRINVDPEQPYRWTTAYNKAGSIGMYSAVLAILPDYDIGFAALLHGDIPGNANFHLLDMAGKILLSAIESASRSEAASLYNGHYSSTTDKLNSSITISTDDLPGLSVTQWISNGTDFLRTSTILQNGYTPVTPRIRLYPADLTNKKQVVFKAIFEDADAPSKEGMFSTDCATWVNVEAVIYGSAAMDEVIFNAVDEEQGGKAGSVSLPALRVTLDREG